tara:strand:- start:103 stop:318 length:216 start_codon:yes stop_codon:yes gene_type:complete
MNKIKTWILDQFGLVDAYKRIVELERVVMEQKKWIDRHESNLMSLHKDTTALQLINKARVNPYKLRSKRNG